MEAPKEMIYSLYPHEGPFFYLPHRCKFILEWQAQRCHFYYYWERPVAWLVATEQVLPCRVSWFHGLPWPVDLLISELSPSSPWPMSHCTLPANGITWRCLDTIVACDNCLLVNTWSESRGLFSYPRSAYWLKANIVCRPRRVILDELVNCPPVKCMSV